MSALVLLALAMRLPNLTESLWYDETWSTRVMAGNFGDVLRATFEDIHPPLYRFISFTWIGMFGDSELAIRAEPLLAGLATVALLPSLGAALGAPKAGWLAGFLVALSPVHIWYSQEARSYSLIMFLAVLLAIVWQRIQDEPSRRRYRVFYVLISITLAQLHYFAIALPTALALVAIVCRRNQVLALTSVAVSVMGVGAVIAIKYVTGMLLLEEKHLVTFTPGVAAGLFEWFLLGGSVDPDSNEAWVARVAAWCLLLMGAGTLLWWLAVGWRWIQRERWLTHAALLLAVPGLLLTLTLLGRKNFFIERSALASLPFLFLAISGAICWIRRETVRRGAILATALSSVVVLFHYHARRDQPTVSKPNPDWRSILIPLERERGTPPRPLLALSTTPLRELAYYMQDAVECSWPPQEPRSQHASPGIRGMIALQFPRSVRLTCGANGTASIRLYHVGKSSSTWVDSVRAYEGDARPVVIYVEHWPASTAGLLRSLLALGHDPRPIARAQGLQVFAID